MPTPRLILASSSVYRRQLMDRLGLDYEVDKPEVDEEQLKSQIDDPTQLAEALAELKAKTVFQRHPNAIVIGSDQVGHFKGQILGKPGTTEKNQQQLQKMTGQTHDLITSVCVLAPNFKTIFTDTTRLTMRNLTPHQIAKYVEADNPLDCAGGYKLELGGIALFQSIESKDFTAIQGLPLIELIDVLKGFGLNSKVLGVL